MDDQEVGVERATDSQVQIVRSGYLPLTENTTPVKKMPEGWPQQPTRVFAQHEQFAQRRASDDVSQITRLIKSEKFVVINPDGVENRINDLARGDISNDYITVNSPKSYDDLVLEYHDAYSVKFEEKLQGLKGGYTKLQDEKEKILRLRLQSDRPSVKSRVHGDHHARDLALLRTLQVYHPYDLLDIDNKVLSGLHERVDHYERYVLDADGKSEVIWPTQDTF